MTTPQHDVASPCVNNCCLNEDDICLGCFRSLDEICQWLQADAHLRQQFLSNANRRRLHYSHRNSTVAN